jgi:hypothetical protein
MTDVEAKILVPYIRYYWLKPQFCWWARKFFSSELKDFAGPFWNYC